MLDIVTAFCYFVNHSVSESSLKIIRTQEEKGVVLMKSMNSEGAKIFPAPDDALIIIEGNIPLMGHVNISGSKHSILHILGALWLLDGKLVIRNTPNIWDVRYILEIYESLGMEYCLSADGLEVVIPSSLQYTEEKIELASKIRSSILLLGSLLVRTGFVKLPAPTGDRIGNRPFAEFFAVLEYFGIYYSIY